MTEPVWLKRLREDDALTARFQLRWLDEGSRAGVRDLARQSWVGRFAAEMEARGLERIERAVPVAIGSRARVGSRAPKTPRCSGSTPPTEASTRASPPGSRLRCGRRSAPAPRRSPRRSRPTPSSSLRACRSPRVVRSLKDAAPEHREVIEQVCEHYDRWLDDATWANAHDDDPWPDYAPARNALQRTVQLREAGQEIASRTPSRGYRTLFSQSALTIEYHPLSVVFVARYAPAPSGLSRDAWASLFGPSLPTDMPLDLAASLLRSGNLLVTDLSDQGPWQPWQTLGRCALEPGEPLSGDDLRARFLAADTDGDARVMLLQLALYYEQSWVLFDLALAAPDLCREPAYEPYFRKLLPASFFEVA
ncbi:MAG: hypothetical protein R3A52_23475 [Polyangiales bacterium]